MIKRNAMALMIIITDAPTPPRLEMMSTVL
jgi:hypothetical protein